MKYIHISDSLSTNLRADLASGTTLEIEDVPLGRGTFGVVYRAISLDGRELQDQIVKVLTNKLNGSDQQGFKTIQALQKKLDEANRRLEQQGSSLLGSYPALLAVPQFSFRGQLDGESIVGYTANDLTVFGMEDFGPFLEDEAKVRALQALPLEARLKLAQQLVSAFDLLRSANYLHADFKPEALYIDIQKPACAIIDFDSGAVVSNFGDQPTTFGTKGPWLAPEILKQLDPSGKPSRIQISITADFWSVSMAVHYLLFGFHPLFFLTEVSDRSLQDYKSQFHWPDADSRCPYFNPALEWAHGEYSDYLRTNLLQLLKPFGATFDVGYMEPSRRTSYAGWATALATHERPEIVSFAADRALVEDSKPVRLTWNVRGQGRLDLIGIADVTDRDHYDVHVRRDTEFRLVFTPHSGQPVESTLQVLVSKQPPVIHRFSCNRPMVSDAKPVNLCWKVTGAERVTVDNGIGDVTHCTSRLIAVRKDTLFTLTAISQFGAVSVATFKVAVSRRMPKIAFFRANERSLEGRLKVKLSWKVSRDAVRVTITGVGPVPNRGETSMNPSTDGSYHLIATSAFGFSAIEHVSISTRGKSGASNSADGHPFWRGWLRK
jgi:serine/threonine protein kinase